MRSTRRRNRALHASIRPVPTDGKSSMALNKDVVEQPQPASSSVQFSLAGIGRPLLLLVELAAVIGLLIGAYQLWQVRQSLADDLATAQEVQAIIREGEAATTGAPSTAAGSTASDGVERQPSLIRRALGALSGDDNLQQQQTGNGVTRGAR